MPRNSDLYIYLEVIRPDECQYGRHAGISHENDQETKTDG